MVESSSKMRLNSPNVVVTFADCTSQLAFQSDPFQIEQVLDAAVAVVFSLTSSSILGLLSRLRIRRIA